MRDKDLRYCEESLTYAYTVRYVEDRYLVAKLWTGYTLHCGRVINLHGLNWSRIS
jgi:DMSO/TMAO reductase YedYZ molybdopterin-dependent catalytic subunit